MSLIILQISTAGGGTAVTWVVLVTFLGKSFGDVVFEFVNIVIPVSKTWDIVIILGFMLLLWEKPI